MPDSSNTEIRDALVAYTGHEPPLTFTYDQVLTSGRRARRLRRFAAAAAGTAVAAVAASVAIVTLPRAGTTTHHRRRTPWGVRPGRRSTRRRTARPPARPRPAPASRRPRSSTRRTAIGCGSRLNRPTTPPPGSAATWLRSSRPCCPAPSSTAIRPHRLTPSPCRRTLRPLPDLRPGPARRNDTAHDQRIGRGHRRPGRR